MVLRHLTESDAMAQWSEPPPGPVGDPLRRLTSAYPRVVAHLHVPRTMSRRGFLTDLGRGTLVVTILGTTTIACSGDDETSATAPSNAPDGDPPTQDGDEDRIDLWFERADFGFVAAYVLARDGVATIVDTGNGELGPIETALAAANSSFDQVTDVVLTHLHGDHVGGIDVVAEAASAARFHAGEADVAGIDTDVDLRALVDGDDVAGLQIVATPGHTAGHVSVFDPVSGILVAGDALNLSSGTLSGSAPEFTADQAAADESVRRLSELGIRTILPGHGEPLTGTAGSQLDSLVTSL